MRVNKEPVLVFKAGADAHNGSNVMQLRARQRPAALCAGTPLAQRADHPEYPLERLCTHLYEPFQLTFARHAQQLFPEWDDVELMASHQGLTIRGETEDAIDATLAVLRDFYGPQIHVGPPTIRYHNGT